MECNKGFDHCSHVELSCDPGFFLLERFEEFEEPYSDVAGDGLDTPGLCANWLVNRNIIHAWFYHKIPQAGFGWYRLVAKMI